MKLRVQKYGGSSLATTDQIRAIAKHIAADYSSGQSFVIIVSAMGHATDELCTLAQKITLTPSRRELEMLLSTGERVSMALMSMALNALNIPATSFTGSQAGILTDDSHNNARILNVTPLRLEDELRHHRVVVLAGFQGVSPRTKEITTLGRGGSDLTAVAMAHHFHSSACEIMKDVDGVYSGDPRVIDRPHHRPHLHFEHLLEFTFWGSSILHYRSVELAQRLNIPIRIGLAPGHLPVESKFETLIDGDPMIFEQPGLVSVNSHAMVARLVSPSTDWSVAMNELGSVLNKNSLPWPQLLDSENTAAGSVFYVTAPAEQLVSLKEVLKHSSTLRSQFSELAPLCSVTATAYGLIGSDLAQILVHDLQSKGIQIVKLSFSSRSLTAFVAADQRERALKLWHAHIQ